MTQIILNIDKLKPSPFNVRSKHTKEDIAMMANSIKNRGIINAPSVAKNGTGYEIIAGNLRVAGARAAGVTQLECDDVTGLSDAERVELSLSENVDRRRMSVVQEYIAFDKLFKAGRSVEEIASRFDKTVKQTQQVLAIGCLPKKILNSDVGDRTIRCLAIAPKADVRRYMKLAEKDRPRDWEIQEWLAGNDGMYLAKHALFNLGLYKGGSFVDLFTEDDEVWLTDGAQFCDLQTEAVCAKLGEFRNKDWTVERLEYWQDWAYKRTAKKKGGKVFWTKDDKTGAHAFYVGYARISRAGSAPKPKKTDEKKDKPDISKEFTAFMAETRHDAVCAEMIDDTRSGLVATLIVLLKNCDNVSLRNQGTRVKNKACLESINNSTNSREVKGEFDTMMAELGISKINNWDINITKLGPKLIEYTEKSLQRWIIAVIARNWTLNGNGKDSDAIGKAVGLTGVRVWEADDAFWNGINNRKTLLAIAAENKITLPAKSTMKVLRGLLKSKVPTTWRPSWLSF